MNMERKVRNISSKKSRPAPRTSHCETPCSLRSTCRKAHWAIQDAALHSYNLKKRFAAFGQPTFLFTGQRGQIRHTHPACPA